VSIAAKTLIAVNASKKLMINGKKKIQIIKILEINLINSRNKNGN
jgi:hypothetical protein